MIAYMRHLAPTLAIVLLASNCAGETAPGKDDSLLSAAVEKTIAAEGFHIEGGFTFEGEEIESEGDYVAPDRMAMSSSDGAESTISIMIGRSNYSSEPDDPNTFRLWEMPCDVGVDTFIPALALARHAEGVRMDRGVFTFRAEGDEGTPIDGEARVTDGYLTGLTLRYTLPHINESVEERWTFSDFGTTVRIRPPPKEQILHDPAVDAIPPVVISTGQPPACP